MGTMEVVSSSSSSSSVQVSSEKLQKNAKSSSEKHESLMTEISSNKKVTNTTSKSEHQQHFVSKTSDSTIEEQINDFVKSTTEEEAKTLLEQISQISASHTPSATSEKVVTISEAGSEVDDELVRLQQSKRDEISA